ncbi:MAG: saccharopine dehydrogenase [bacterium]|nr:saccharopine dehydrogenase [bacterium]
MRTVVLGGGRVGAAIARDLAVENEFEVTVVDCSDETLASFGDEPAIRCERADLGEPAELRRVIEDQDLVVEAVPGAMGFATLRGILECGKNVVDISFFAEDAFELDELAREQKVTALVDCGVAPGSSNVILGRLEEEMDRVEKFTCYVGGLPVIRTWPYEFKAPFSPFDIIEEYVRPARLVEHGEVVTRPAFSEAELVDFPGVGTLEAFLTDGLRSLLHTSQIPDMTEKTLRYRGHIEKMRMLRDSGFFSQEPLEVGGVTVRPLDVTARLLFPMWQFEEDEEDFTVMRILVEGCREGRRQRHCFDLLDRYDRRTGTTSMARTTGYTCTAIVRLVAGGHYSKIGISPPELVGREPGCYERVMRGLSARGIVFREQVETIEEPG